jgi:hypothetical protein
MLCRFSDQVILNLDSIESIKPIKEINPDYIPDIPGEIEGNNQPPFFEIIEIVTKNNNVFTIKACFDDVWSIIEKQKG